MEGFQEAALFRRWIRRQLGPGFQEAGKLLYSFTKPDDIRCYEYVFGFHFTKKLSLEGGAGISRHIP